jgi:DNA primase
MPQGLDPADLVKRDGAEAMRERVARSVPFVSFHVDKILSTADLGDAEGKDRAIADLRPVIATVPASVLREELIHRIAVRLDLSDQLAKTLLEQRVEEAPAAGGRAAGWGGDASDRGATEWEGPSPDDEEAYWASLAGEDAAPATTNGAGSPSASVFAHASRHEREFLRLCVSLPRDGAAALATLDLEQHFTGALARRAAAHLAAPDRLSSPMDGLPADDRDLEQFVFSLVREAAEREGRDRPANLEHAALTLELRRLTRAIARVRAGGEGSITELGKQQQAIRPKLAELDERIQQQLGD